MNKIKVLWMNNGDESLMAFVQNTDLRNLDITTCKNMKECRSKLLEDWDAIIMNSAPRLENEIPKSQNLRTAYIQIIKTTNAPIFIVTANEEFNEVTKREARSLSGDKFYELQKSSSELFEAIKVEIENNEDYHIHLEYEKIIDFYREIDDGKSDTHLMYLLRNLRKDDLYKNQSIPTNVRLVLDKVMTFLTNKGILKETSFNGSNLADCGRELGKRTDIPLHIQRFVHSCVYIANNGSHQILEEERDNNYRKRNGNPLSVQKQITDRKAPYLNKALIYDLLNILYWCANLNDN